MGTRPILTRLRSFRGHIVSIAMFTHLDPFRQLRALETLVSEGVGQDESPHGVAAPERVVSRLRRTQIEFSGPDIEALVDSTSAAATVAHTLSRLTERSESRRCAPCVEVDCPTARPKRPLE